MDSILYWFARALIGLIKALPLRLVARLGRGGGALFYWLDARHRQVALENLTRCFGKEKPQAEIRALARENFRRIGENFASAVKTAFMSMEELRPHFQCEGIEKFRPGARNRIPHSRIVAIGHFGNFELFARLGELLPEFQGATTYRGLRQPALERLMQSVRERSGCRFFERRTEAAALKAALSRGGVLLGLLADQHAGDRGLWLPFLGHPASTGVAPAVLALRYRCFLHSAICYRVGLAKWRIEVGDEIPTVLNGQERTVEEIMADINRAFEEAVRRDPANWFWVHKRWKPMRRRKPEQSQFAEARS
jgi:KDO2-lipid IV(A) lauroyltransferase